MPQDSMDMTTLLPSRSDHVSGLETDAASSTTVIRFTDQLLGALAGMAVRSKRRQADLSAAMARAGLMADQADMEDALAELQSNGMIENIVPLYDGGILVSVTSRGIERRGKAVRWGAAASGIDTLRAESIPRHVP